jgi:predicted signal transduction protein with EAL and GGDEF domain
MVEITGYRMEDINRVGWYQTLYPDPGIQERARDRMERMRTGEDLRNERWEIRRADGQVLNDARGHLEGDRALQAIGRALRESVRSTDVVARVGGDEFAVVLLATGVEGARTFFDALQEKLLRVIRAGGWEIGFGVGVVTFVDRVPDLSEALRKADDAMYRAKRAGESATVCELFCSGQESA